MGKSRQGPLPREGGEGKRTGNDNTPYPILCIYHVREGAVPWKIRHEVA